VDLVHGRLRFGVEPGRAIPELADWRVGPKGVGGLIECEVPNVYFDSFKYAVTAFVESLLAVSSPRRRDGWNSGGAGGRCAYESARAGQKVVIQDV